MTDTKPSTIEEAPSLADITSAGDRVGKVDFTAKLGDRMDPEPEQDDAAARLASMARPQRPAAETEGDDEDGPKMPFILPPATVDTAMAAEAQRTKQEIAAARGELPDDELDDEADTDVLDDEPDTDDIEVAQPEVKTETKAERKAARAAARAEAKADTQVEAPAMAKVTSVPTTPPATMAPVPTVAAPGLTGLQAVRPVEPVEVTPEPEKHSGPPEGLLIQEVADLDAVAAEVAHHEAEEELRADAAEVTRLHVESEATVQDAQDTLARAAFAIDPVELQAIHDEAEELALRNAEDAPLRSVTEVANSVIAAMRQINDAHERHVESLELETARRCELLTAQAELDAELIRLHARREAHAIISAARLRSGEHDPESVETDQLGEIGETFSRFAETIETTVATGLESPDHLRKS